MQIEHCDDSDAVTLNDCRATQCVMPARCKTALEAATRNAVATSRAEKIRKARKTGHEMMQYDATASLYGAPLQGGARVRVAGRCVGMASIKERVGDTLGWRLAIGSTQ